MVSIIIVNFNGLRFLKRLLDSIFKQDYKKLEVIFIDNSSRDGSIKFVNKNYPRVKTFIKKNEGFGSGCNFGAKVAKGEFLVFLNEDMYLPKTFLREMVNYRKTLEENSAIKIGAIGCKMVDFDADPLKMPEKYGAHIDIFGFPIENKKTDDIFIISGCPYFIKKDLFNFLKGFNESIFLYGEDVDFSWRLKIFGYNLFMNKNTCIFHYGGGVSGLFLSKKTARIICSSFVSIFSNYSTILIYIILPLYFGYMCFLNVYLFFTKKFDFSYNLEIFKTFWGFLVKINLLLAFRQYIQNNRKLSDWDILHYVSFIPAFVKNLSFTKLSPNYIIKN